MPNGVQVQVLPCAPFFRILIFCGFYRVFCTHSCFPLLSLRRCLHPFNPQFHRKMAFWVRTAVRTDRHPPLDRFQAPSDNRGMAKTMRKPMNPMPFDGIEDGLIPEAHHKLIYRFFLVFSRFEYALKRAGYAKGSGTDVAADWDKYSSDYRQAHLPSTIPGLRNAWAYFSSHPPRKQILKNNRIVWSEPQVRTSEPELTWLLASVRTVRNNLFHGGKYPYRPVREPARDSTLLQHTLTVIDVCSAFNNEVSDSMRSFN